MKQELVAVPVYKDRISPLLDVAKRFAVYEITEGEIKQKITIDINTESESHKVEKLSELGVSLIIGGAISGFISQMISEKGIRLISWVSGQVDEVIEAYLRRELTSCLMQKPFCKRRRRGRYITGIYLDKK